MQDGTVGRTCESAPTVCVNLMAHSGYVCAMAVLFQQPHLIALYVFIAKFSDSVVETSIGSNYIIINWFYQQTQTFLNQITWDFKNINITIVLRADQTNEYKYA